MSLNWDLRVHALFGAQKSHEDGSLRHFGRIFLLIQATRICVANINRHLPIHLDDFWVQLTKFVDESRR